MMTRFGFLLMVCWSVDLFAQSMNQRLGYTDDDILLIVHADDLGCAHSENVASFEAMDKGIVNSGSIIVPSPWFHEVVKKYKEKKNYDLGIHLALTSEWQDYKWGPVAPIDKVRSLVNKYGFFYSSTDSVAKYADIKEVELELTAQIEKCKSLGMDITHLDSHMGWFLLGPKFMDVYVKLSKKYKLPILYNKQMLALAKGKETYAYWIDEIMGVPTEAYPDKMIESYKASISKLRPGIHELILHVAYDNAETQAIFVNHPHWGAAWRQIDNNFVMSEDTRKLLNEKNIKLVTWREIRDKVIRKK